MVKFLSFFCLLGTTFAAPSIVDSLSQARDAQPQQQQQIGQSRTIQFQTSTV